MGASSSNILLQLDPLLQQTLQARLNLQLHQQNLRGIPPPQITSAGVASANVSTQQTTQEERDEADEEQSEAEVDSDTKKK